MARKPSNLIYGVDESPALYELIVLGIQHVFIISVAFVFPVIIIQESGGTPQQAATMIQMSMVAAGIGVILQAFKKGPIGSGYLCPEVCGPSFLSASILAAQTGGLGAVFAGTFFGGFFEAIFSRVVKHMRAFFPPEVTGTVVAMVGITIIPFAMPRFFGLNETNQAIRHADIFVAITTLAIMCGATIWGKDKLRLYNIIIGMTTGYLLSFVFGIYSADQVSAFSSAAYFSLPKPILYGWSISWGLVLPFIVASLCSSLKTIGDLATCQKINDADWKRTDMESVSRGLLADAACAMGSGLLGGMGQSTSSSNIALSMATGATSRKIAWATGITLVVVSFFPKLATVFVIMPIPVMGATLVFVVSFMIVVGFQIITTRMLDARKILVVGISIILGLSVDMVPGAYAHMPGWIAPIFSSSLSLATVSVVILNLLARIGIAQKKVLVLKPGIDSGETIYQFMDDQGRTWGARPEIISKGIRVITEFFEANEFTQLTKNDIETTVSFDEFNLDITIGYKGRPLEFPDGKPTPEELMADETAIARLSAIIIRRTVDRMQSEEKNGQITMHFHFDH